MDPSETVALPNDLPPEPSAFEATVLEGPSSVISPLDQRVVQDAIQRQLITAAQGQSVLQSLAGMDGGGPERTVQLMLERGLITRDAADALRERGEEDFVPGYRIQRELGRGAMGVVYEAVQRRLDRRVALKAVNPQLSADESYVKRFKQEALALAKLNHPNIVQVYDYGEVAGRIFLALEFVDGRDCADLLKERGRLSEREALRLVRDAALGLAHAHAAGIVHRDVKPANLLVIEHGPGDLQGKVTDLGLAREQKRTGGDLTEAGTVLGTPSYMAPEQTDGDPADHRSDIYALGATLYHLVTGKLPYEASSVINILIKKRTEALTDPQQVVPSLSPGTVRVMDRMLARPPGERYQSYAALLADVDAVRAGRPPAATPVPREASSLSLARNSSALRAIKPSRRLEPLGASSSDPLADPLRDPLNDPRFEDAEPAPAPARTGRAPGLVVAGLLLLGLGGLAFKASDGGSAVDLSGGADVGAVGTSLDGAPPPANGSSRAVIPPPPDPTSAARLRRVDKALTAYEALGAGPLLVRLDALGELRAEVLRLPEGDVLPARLRLETLVGQALTETEADARATLTGLWRQGDYARLQDGVAQRERAYELAGWPVPDDVQALAGHAAAAAKDGLGAAEREAWGALEAVFTTDGDPLAVLERSAGFAERFPFSPVLDEVAARRAAALAATAQLELTVEPAEAELVLGDRTQAGGWSGRVRRGEHVLAARAPGHFELVEVLKVAGDLQRSLVLGPRPAQELGQDPTRQALLFRPNAFPREWAQRGAWQVVLEQAGVVGEASDRGASTARRQLSAARGWRAVADLAGWSLSLEVIPQGVQEGGSTAGAPELKSVGAEVWLEYGDGRPALVLSVGQGVVTCGLRRGKQLEVRFRRPWSGDAPAHLRVDWDGRIAVIELGDDVLGSFALEAELPAPELVLAVTAGRALFRNLQVHGLVSEPR